MRKKQFLIILLTAVTLLSAFAANWYDGQNISGFALAGLKNVSVTEVDKVVYPYRGNQYSDSVLKEIEEKLYKIDGIDYIEVEAKRDATKNELVLVLHIHELPLVGEVKFEGNEKVKTATLTEALTVIQAGKFADLDKGSVIESAKNQVLLKYSQNGFEGTEVSVSKSEGDNGVSNVTVTVKEGIQYRITEITFEGNNNVSESILKKEIDLKKKSLFEKGLLDKDKLDTDCDKIVEYYNTNGYLDALVVNKRIEDISTGKHDWREVRVVFEINEGKLWYFGGLTFEGNTVFTDEEIKKAAGDLVTGGVLNLKVVENAYTAVQDLYYNNGYIRTKLPLTDERDDTTMTVKFVVSIIEGSQSHVEAVNFSGLNKTNEIVMRRELELKPGDIFSKAKFTTSAQNLYNTGLLSDLDYEMTEGEEEDGVIIDFNLTEGSTMDIQFGATFGGSATGFPISGFLSWSNKNFRGMGQDLSVSTTVSPTTQSMSVSFGDDWFFNKRWSNSFSFSFSHTYNEDEYQLGTNSPMYDGKSETEAYQKPFTSYEEAKSKLKNDDLTYNESDLMDYDMIDFTLGYSTGYTWIYDVGRLGVSGGLTFGLNRALYDDCYTPYRKIINEYGKAWQWSNKLSFSFQWDGRDYVTNTTKGYVTSLTATAAGGLLGGLSNYNKLSLSLAGYHKIVDIPTSETSKTPIMLCASSTASIILPQFDFYDKDKDSKFIQEATQDEMLYIDGMTIARGHNFLSYQSFLWDNMLELSYQLVPGVIQAEVFTNATYCREYLKKGIETDGWYMGVGAGLKLKISGFPLGFYLVKNASILPNDTETNGKFTWDDPSDGIGNSGIHFVLAISTSLI